MSKQSILSRRLEKARSRDKQSKNSFSATNSEPALSFSQKRFYFLEQLKPDSYLTNRPFAWQLTGSLSRTIFKQTISTIVDRHTVLRTSILANGGSIKLQENPTEPIDVPLIDLSRSPNSEQVEALQQQIATFSKRPISLSESTLIRSCLIRQSADQHIALFVTHHMTFDALSEEVFKREFAAIYQAFAAGLQPDLKPLSVQYADFSRWQRAELKSNRLKQLDNYWQAKLANAPHYLPLPTDRPRPIKKSNRGGTVTIEFPADLVSQLQRFSQQQNSTLFTTLLAPFYILLYRYTHQKEILIGTPVSGRTLPESQNLIGFFANTLVLRGDMSADPTFSDFLQAIRHTMLSAIDHQDYPIEELLKSIGGDRGNHIPPLFQVMFNLETVSGRVELAQGPTIESFDFETGTAIYDLNVELQHDGEALAGEFIYDSDLFDLDTIKRWADNYFVLLRSCISRPQCNISKLPLLTEAEQIQLLTKWNRTAEPYDRDVCIHELFEQQVAIRPNQIAVTYEAQSITYQALNGRANQLAHRLIELGVQPDQLVGIMLDRSIAMVVGLMAILKAGGAYVPVDPQLPAERIKFMLDDSQVNIILTEGKWHHVLPKSVKYTVCVDKLDFTTLSKKSFKSRVAADHLAYMIYTSGSTGTPKGTMISHRNLHSYVHGRKRAGIYSENDVMLHGSTLSFDIAVEEIFCPLLLGGQVVLLNPIGFKDIGGILETIQKNRVTAFTTTPSVLAQCLDSKNLEKCSGLTKVILGGESLTKNLYERWNKQTGIQLINSYGPTETTVDVTTFDCKHANRYETIPIGRPSANCQIYILDGNLNPVPIGVAGEIMIGGDGVGRGYWQRPELTAERFIPNPHSDGRLYRTGDLGRFLADGNIEFLGRIDHQTKIRGFRVELGEIESTLLSHPDIEKAAVLALNLNGTKQLVAYTVHLNQIEADALRAFISEKLPDYMHPPYLVPLDDLPLMLNGKVDLQALPKPSSEHLATAKQFVPPSTATEKRLVTIWQEVLKVEPISMEDNFFSLGGHSLLVTQTLSRIRAAFEVDFPMKTFFDSPRLADQAMIIEFMTDR